MTLRRLSRLFLIGAVAGLAVLVALGVVQWRAIQADFAVFDRINRIEKTAINFEVAIKRLLVRPDSDLAITTASETARTLDRQLASLAVPAVRPARQHLQEITRIVDTWFRSETGRARTSDPRALEITSRQLELHQVGFSSVLKALVHERYRASRQTVQDVILTYGVVSIALFLLPLIAFVAIRQRIVLPTRRIIDGLERIKRGETDARIDLDNGGELARIAHAINDMTEAIRERGSRLREWNQRFGVAADVAGLGVWELDLDDDTLVWDPRMFNIYGVEPSSFSGDFSTWRSCVHPDDRPAVESTMQQAMNGDGIFDTEFRVVHPDESIRHVKTFARIAFDEETGRPASAIGADMDITEQRVTEARLVHAQKLETVGQLTGGMAHDFNNVLTVVGGNLQLLARREAVAQDDKARSWIDSALKAVERGAGLSQRLLAFARRQQLETVTIDVNELLEGMEDMLIRTLGENIELEVHRARALPLIRTDLSQLENAILNLAVNARDAMPGGGQLTIEASHVTLTQRYADTHFEVEPGEYVLIAVTDTGEGMPPDVLDRAFEPFFTTKETGKGTGLGLSSVFGFAKQSGGQATIYSEPGIGTTVKLYFPVEREAGEAGVADTGAASQRPTGGDETILVVDDNAPALQTTVDALESFGYSVLTAEDGPSALRILADHPEVDLLLTDVVMPGGLNGIELAREAQANRPDLRVLFTSGYAEEALRRDRGGNLGPGDWIVKPIDIDKLAGKVRDVLSRAE